MVMKLQKKDRIGLINAGTADNPLIRQPTQRETSL